MEEIKRKILKNKFSRVILEWDRRIEQNAYRYNFEEFTLSSGLPGVILLLLEMEDLDRTYKFKIDQYCDYLYGKLSKYGLLTGSLYSGAAGIALSLLPLKKDLRFQNLIASLNDYISYYVDKEIGEFNIENVTPPNYDVIEGLSGILMYLLLIDNIDIKLVTKIIIFLLTLLDDNDSLIAMYIKTGNQMSEAENEIYPNGCLNTGMSHGLAGVGSVLAYAYKKGFMKKEILHGLERIIQIYEKFELVDKNKFHWKDGIDYNELVNNRTILKDNDLFIRDAWCYGSPGISVLYLYIGLIQDNSYLIKKAIEILYRATKEMRNVDSNMICHGKSGIVSICILFRKLTKTRKFDTFINNYTDEIESIFDKDIRNLGFLEGTTGIILTLNECFSNKGKTQWMKSLMLFDDF